MLPAPCAVRHETSGAVGICGMLADRLKRWSRLALPTPMIVSRYFDRIAITLSTICIVHCLATPLVVAILPIAALTVGSDAHFHWLMLWLAVPTSAVGFGLGYRAHHRPGLVAVGAFAVAVLALVALWGHGAWDPTVEIVINVAASVLLAAAHWHNFQEVRRVHRHA